MSTQTENYSSEISVEKKRVVDNKTYDIDRLLSQFFEHWDRHTEKEIEPELEGYYRGFSIEEDYLEFELVGERSEKAVISLKYRDQERKSAAKGKLEEVWNNRIEKVLERSEKENVM